MCLKEVSKHTVPARNVARRLGKEIPFGAGGDIRKQGVLRLRLAPPHSAQDDNSGGAVRVRICGSAAGRGRLGKLIARDESEANSHYSGRWNRQGSDPSGGKGAGCLRCAGGNGRV